MVLSKIRNGQKTMNEDDDFIPRVICDGGCGVVELTIAEYEYQLDRPDSLWQCPNCGDSARWDNSCL